MVFSKGTGYGIRALAFLARHNEMRRCGLNEIAASEQIPSEYLRKLLTELRRHWLIKSVKGIGGGYLLAKEPWSITLWDVFSALDQDPYLDECVLCGSPKDKPPCPFCSEWRQVGQDLESRLRSWTIAKYAGIAPANI